MLVSSEKHIQEQVVFGKQFFANEKTVIQAFCLEPQ